METNAQTEMFRELYASRLVASHATVLQFAALPLPETSAVKRRILTDKLCELTEEFVGNMDAIAARQGSQTPKAVCPVCGSNTCLAAIRPVVAEQFIKLALFLDACDE